LLELVEPETAGDPQSERKWVRVSLRNLADLLKPMRPGVSPATIARLLRKNDYSLRVNAKEKEPGSQHPDRNEQFEYIEKQVAKFRKASEPIISVDTKKKELIGEFKQAGKAWVKDPIEVNVHDFSTQAEGRATPYGIYDLQRNQGAVYVGISADTPEFAVTAITRWWQEHGRAAYPTAREILILADAGGSNGCQPRMWKVELQNRLSNQFGLKVTVCHYPRGCSKWNPIEHRLFSEISLNWSGQPLRTFKTMLGFIGSTTTKAGLKVTAHLLEGVFVKGKKVLDSTMKMLRIKPHSVCPKWNYTIHPQTTATP
jgi:hypothetical protein